MSSQKNLLRVEGHKGLRQRLVLAIISGRNVKITKIRSEALDPGLNAYEISFIQLLEKITNGSHFEISPTGTSLLFCPGTIIGGSVTHECHLSRGIGYFLEPVLILAPFAKSELDLTLKGITNNNIDISVDLIRTVLIPCVSRFSKTLSGIEFKVLKRGALPLGGGEVNFKCPIIHSLDPIEFTTEGQIRKIRGLAYTTRTSTQIAKRLANHSREVLTKFIPDVYIFTDTYKGDTGGLSPGFALSLVAESTTGVLYSSELAFESNSQECTKFTFETPDDLARKAVSMLLAEIEKGGCFNTHTQWIAIVLSALGPQYVSKFRLSNLSNFSISYLRDIELFLKTKFKLKTEVINNRYTLLLSSVGIDYVNISKSHA